MLSLPESDSHESDDMLAGQGPFGIVDNVVDLHSFRPMISQVPFYW